MDMFDFAGLLFGGDRASPDATTVTATGAAASSDGEVGITLDADVTPAEDEGTDEDTEQTIIDLPTSPDVDEGDELIVTLVGDGPLKTPVVTANPGSGDRMRALADSAKAIADTAQAVADAINQHFWVDDSGAHVTQATQDEWQQDHSGPNSLWNALGMLFRDGLTNLLVVLHEGIAIYDGNGNESKNIIARLLGSGIQIGRDSEANVSIGSDSIDMRDGPDEVASFVTKSEPLGDGGTSRASNILMGGVGSLARVGMDATTDQAGTLLRVALALEALADDSANTAAYMRVVSALEAFDLYEGNPHGADYHFAASARSLAAIRANVIGIGTNPDGGSVHDMRYWRSSDVAAALPHTRGHVISGTWRGAGYVTSGGTVLTFTIPLAAPVAEGATLAMSTGATTMECRQGGAYVFSASSSGGMTALENWFSGVAVTRCPSGVNVVLTKRTAFAGATNNDTIGVSISYVIEVG